MAHTSPYPDVVLPQTDLWSYLYERPDVPFGPDHGEYSSVRSVSSFSDRKTTDRD
jgi:hypothetical protein